MKKQKMTALGITKSEDPFVTGIVMTIASVAFLAYVCLCCHVCGLQYHIRQLLRSISAYQVREERPLGSAPVFGRYLTPPPRYSDIANSLPSYSCALRRMLQLVNGPVHLRFVVHVDKNDGGGPVLDGQTQTTGDNSQVFSDHNRLSYDLGSYRLMPVLEHSPTSETRSSRKESTSSDENSPKETMVIKEGIAHSAIKITVESSPFDHATDLGGAISPVTVPENVLELAIHDQANGSPLPMTLDQTPVSLDLEMSSHERSSHNGVECQSTNNSITSTEGVVQGANLRRETISASEYPSSIRNGLTENSIKLLMSGIRGMEQVVLATESSPNCYVAHWPVPSKDHIDTDGLEVSVEGHPVDKIYVEFLNAGGQSICMAQLLPTHNSNSPNNQMRYHYRVPVSPPQGLPNLLGSTSPPSSSLAAVTPTVSPPQELPSLLRATSTPSSPEAFSSTASVTPTLTLPSVTSSDTPSSLTSRGLTSSSLTHATETSSLMTSSLVPMSSSSGTPSGESSLMMTSLTPSSAESSSGTPLHFTPLSGPSLNHT
ncbi:uncharacterized protein [Palaemon carinicauda]|uniref:uncharacterized protein n=1 Tax=Palaemon carinicauda TaxID=392227 RepID=UPI0035B58A1A